METDSELRLTLARMLSSKIGIEQVGDVYTPFWRGSKLPFTPVLDTELLYCCHLVEQGLTTEQDQEYQRICHRILVDFYECESSDVQPIDYITMDWQQKVAALQQIVNKKV